MVLLFQALAISSPARSDSPRSSSSVAGSVPSPSGEGTEFDFEFSGVYTWGEVIASLCRDGWCRTQLPRDFHNLSVPLGVYEHTWEGAWKALSMQALADGYLLKKSGKKKPYTITAELDQEKQASFVSCLDTSVRSVPARDLFRYRMVDSVKCLARARDLDYKARLSDSLFYPVTKYRVSFYVVSSAFLRTLGVDWTTIWAKGNLVHMPTLITDWSLKATASDDTTAEFRSIEVDMDSTITLHWGSQKKEAKSTVVYNNGVAQSDYEWKNYGLTLTLTRDVKNGLRADYQLAQRDENNSVLSGKFGGGGSDSISAWGVYDSYQTRFTGIPWLYKIPVIGYLFGTEHVDKVKSFFVIQVFKVQRDTVNFPVLDSLRIKEVYDYENIRTDSTDTEPDSLDRSQDTLSLPPDSLGPPREALAPGADGGGEG